MSFTRVVAEPIVMQAEPTETKSSNQAGIRIQTIDRISYFRGTRAIASVVKWTTMSQMPNGLKLSPVTDQEVIFHLNASDFARLNLKRPDILTVDSGVPVYVSRTGAYVAVFTLDFSYFEVAVIAVDGSVSFMEDPQKTRQDYIRERADKSIRPPPVPTLRK